MTKQSKDNKAKRVTKFIINKFNSWVLPVLEVVGAFAAVTILLGLAYKGSQEYLTSMSDDAENIVAILIVAGLTYIVAVGFKRITK